MTGTFRQNGALSLWVAGLPGSAAWVPKGLHIGFLIRHLKVGAIHRHESIACKKGVGMLWASQRAQAALANGLQGLPREP